MSGEYRVAKPLLGIAIVVVTVLFFAISDIITKSMTAKYPVPVIGFIRYLSSLVLLMVFIYPKLRHRLWQTQRTAMVILRGAVLSVATLTMGLSLREMPVAEAVSIVYLAPFAVMALAVPLLGEKLTAANWILASLGFGGVMLVINPEGDTSTNGILFALANAGCATAFHLLSRVLSATESSISMLFYVTLAGVIGFAATGAIDTFTALPTLQDLGWMSLLGLIATTGHFLLSQAYRYAPASIVAPMNYLHIVWAAALGYLFFDETPGLWAAIGMITIIGSGAMLAWQVNRNTPKTTPSN